MVTHRWLRSLANIIFPPLGRTYSTTTPMKPPNILLNTPCLERFTKQKKALTTLLPNDTYTVYHLDHEQFRKQGWLDACVLLVCECDQSSEEDITMQEDTGGVLDTFLSKHNGKVLFHGDSCGKSLQLLKDVGSDDVMVNGDKVQLEEIPVERKVVVLKEDLSCVSSDAMKQLLRILGVVTASAPEQKDLFSVPAFYYSSDEKVGVSDVFDFDSTNPLTIQGDGLRIVCSDNINSQQEQNDDGDDTLVLNIVHSISSRGDFDWGRYKANLKTKQYGRQILFKNILPSTQDVLTKLRSKSINTDGFVVTAARQTKGRGRGGNAWLSPLGCMMFSIRLTIPMRSTLGQHLACIQHLIVVAFVKAVRERAGYEDIALHIKWPNDIYVNGSTKIGGVIVNCSTCGDDFVVIIGCGVNVNNEKPTLCVNSVIREHNERNGTEMKELAIESVLASTINHLENLVEIFQTQGVIRFKEEYYRYWLHSGAEVVLEMMDNIEAVVLGIDDFGYLEVQLGSGEKVSLQPDGNTFDLMKNMIGIKKR